MLPKALWQRIKRSNFIVQLMNWEYWPIYIVNIPVVGIWLWFALRARSPFFFSTANPAIKTGGLFGESKIDILRLIPEQHIPITLFIPASTDFETLKKRVLEKGLQYPLIAKPNVGERGLLVSVIKNEQALSTYLGGHQIDFILQELITLPLEVSVLYHRMPMGGKGKVTSICIKEMLAVIGDGKSSVEELMSLQARAKLQLPRFQKEQSTLLRQRPKSGEVIALEPIGNHCRGTMFLNGNAYIDEAINEVFDKIGQQMKGVYYGRFDMKCESIEALKKGEGFKALEFNGVASEAAHIYDPAYPIWKKYRDIYRHWRIIFEISQQQKKLGLGSMKISEVRKGWREYMAYMKSI